MVCMTLLAAAPAMAETPGEKGVRLFRGGEYEKAAQAFMDADMENPRQPVWRYNRGVAAHAAGDLEQAESAFASAAKRAGDQDLRFRTEYNLGNTAMEKQDFESAVEHYREALRIDPDDPDARENMKLALWKKARAEQMQQQQEQGDRGEESDREKKDGEQQKGDGDRQGKDQPEQEKQEGRQESEKSDEQERDQQGGQQQQEDQQGEQEQQEDQQGEQEQQAGQSEQQETKPEDLEGELAGTGDEQQQPDADQGDKAPAMTMEKRKARALLDNVDEPSASQFRGRRRIDNPRPRSGKLW